jgi:hypothetical protein
MISYATEDNEDTEPMLEKTYQDALIPLQGELLNTEIVEPTSHWFQNKKLITGPKLYSQSPKISKPPNNSLSYKP